MEIFELPKIFYFNAVFFFIYLHNRILSYRDIKLFGHPMPLFQIKIIICLEYVLLEVYKTESTEHICLKACFE